MKFIGLFLLTFFLFSCSRSYLSVQSQWVDKSSLASSYVRTPDPRQKDPKEGENIVISWRFPKDLYEKNLSLAITVRFWDNSEKRFSKPISYKRGDAVYFFSIKEYPRILTYQIKVLSERGELIEVWDHQLWTKLITVDQGL